MSKFKCMKKNENGVMIANTEAVQAIRDFLSDWYDVPSIYKTLASAYSELNDVTKSGNVDVSALDNVSKALDQCMMMVELLEPFKDNGEHQ